MTNIDFNYNNHWIIYNLIFTFISWKLLINLPSVKTSFSVYYFHLHYVLMLIYLFGLVIVELYIIINIDYVLPSEYLIYINIIQQLKIFTTIMNIVDIICISVFYTYTFMNYEYYKSENEKAENEKLKVEESEDEESEDKVSENEELEDEESEDEVSENEELEDEDSENSVDDSITYMVNNLSNECIDEIKEILGNYNERQLRLLVRTINKDINKY